MCWSSAIPVHLLSEKVDCAVVNAGDGSHEHPTQALLDALTIRRHSDLARAGFAAITDDLDHEVARASRRGATGADGARDHLRRSGARERVDGVFWRHRVVSLTS
jgi:aspartate carbamoyltransferase catalytic subunit